MKHKKELNTIYNNALALLQKIKELQDLKQKEAEASCDLFFDKTNENDKNKEFLQYNFHTFELHEINEIQKEMQDICERFYYIQNLKNSTLHNVQ